MPEADPFSDVLTANAAFAGQFQDPGLNGRAGKGLAVLTCMDTRIDPLRMLGLVPGDAKILRNAGARVTDDILKTLVLATSLLGVSRVMVIAHTGCKMVAENESAVHQAISDSGGPDTRSLSFLTAADQVGALAADVQRIRSYPYLTEVESGGFVYDLETGRVERHV